MGRSFDLRFASRHGLRQSDPMMPIGKGGQVDNADT